MDKDYQAAPQTGEVHSGQAGVSAPLAEGSANTTDRISGGAVGWMPTCSTCPFQVRDSAHPGWGWCGHARNRVYAEGWPNGFTPSQSPTGSCNLHPKRTGDRAQPPASGALPSGAASGVRVPDGGQSNG